MFFLALSLALLGDDLRRCSGSQVYVVYMGKAPQQGDRAPRRRRHAGLHRQMLTAVHDGSWEKARASHVYTYSAGFQGFAAKLNKKQAIRLAEMPGVVSVFPNTKRRLRTTHSWDFMGLSTSAEGQVPGLSTENQENVIVGFIDTGDGVQLQ